jgi:thiamine-phosphate pyrophosphorylase
MDQIDLRLLAIAGPPFVDPSSVVAACQAAEAGGVTAVQVRFKNAPAAVTLRVTEQLVDILSIPVYVNDRADIALAAGAYGVHLGAEDLAPSRVRVFAETSFKIGVSVGTHAEADSAVTERVDYWSTGSVFQTQSKSDAGEPIGTDGFRDVAGRAPPGMPVIAVGGITKTNAPSIIEAGAQGIAVISAVFGTADVEHAARELRDILDATLSTSPL